MTIVKATVWLTDQSAGQFEFWRSLLPAGYTLLQHDPTTYLLDSPEFASMRGLQEEVGLLLERLTQLAHLFRPASHGDMKLAIRQVAYVEDKGRRYADSRVFSIHPATPVAPELYEPDRQGQTVPTRLLQAADADDEVDHGLRLLREPQIGWPAVYDIIEFLQGHGMPVGPASGDWISSTSRDRYKQTANFYRHLGRTDLILPASPPSLEAAQTTWIGLLRRWLLERINQNVATG